MATAVVNGDATLRRRRVKLPERLPALRGKWLTAYSLLWITIATISIAGTIGGAFYRLQVGAGQAYTLARLGIDVGDGRPVIRNVAGTSSGIVDRGDRLLSVNGVRMPTDRAAQPDQSIAVNNALLVPEGTPVHLIVRTRGGRLRAVQATSSRENAEALFAPTGLGPDVVT